MYVLIQKTIVEDFMIATVTLNNTEIKGLPTGYKEIVSAPGIGKMIFPLYSVWESNFQVAYGNINIDANNLYKGRIYLVWDAPNYYNNASGPVEIGLDQAPSRNIAIVGPATGNLMYAAPIGGTWTGTVDGIDYGTYASADDGYDNAALYVGGQNSSQNFTGGDPVNTLKVTVIYVVIDL